MTTKVTYTVVGIYDGVEVFRSEAYGSKMLAVSLANGLKVDPYSVVQVREHRTTTTPVYAIGEGDCDG